MNAPMRTVYVAPIEHLTKFDELDAVRLIDSAQDSEGRTIAAGSRGTVVAIWAEGRAFEVEFEQPFHALATIDAKNLERAATA